MPYRQNSLNGLQLPKMHNEFFFVVAVVGKMHAVTCGPVIEQR